MKTTKPLSELIAQLVELEKNNPGIHYVIKDNEWGLGNAQTSIEKVMLEGDIEYGHLRDVSKEGYESIIKGIKFYEDNSLEDLWAQYTDEEKMLYNKNDFNNFLKAQEDVIKNYMKEKEQYEQAQSYVIISLE